MSHFMIADNTRGLYLAIAAFFSVIFVAAQQENLLTASIAYGLIGIVVVLFYAVFSKEIGSFGIKKPLRGDILFGIIIGLGLYTLSKLSSGFSLATPPVPASISTVNQLLIILFVAIVLEEALFRDAVLNFSNKIIKNPWIAIVMQAIFFAVLHWGVYGGMEFTTALIGAGIFGLIVGIVAYFRKTTTSGMVAHFIINALIVLPHYIS